MVYCGAGVLGVTVVGRCLPLVGCLEEFMMSRYCLVVVHTPLVAQDLALMLEDMTGCSPILVERIEEACDKLNDLGPGTLPFAFVHADAAALRASPLAAAIERLGGRPILLGHAAELEAAQGAGHADWPVLEQPFGPAQVAELLQRCPPPALEKG